ncbi:MAG TPA: signal peptidase II [Sedimentisphaerales bacterium]|nr:signal peptidase II [Sedimentisphaerales bacterium]
MGELKKDEQQARPMSGRAFLSRAGNVRAPGWKEHIVFWSIAVSGLALDLWSKSAVFNWLAGLNDNRYSLIDGFLHLEMALNSGAAFGKFQGQYHLLIAVSMVALVVIFWVFLFGGRKPQLTNIALALFAAGVCGNLHDRVFNDGLVRDFVDVVYWPGRHWPAFNVADTMLCVAVGLLIISSLFSPTSSQTHGRQRKGEHLTPHQGQ